MSASSIPALIEVLARVYGDSACQRQNLRETCQHLCAMAAAEAVDEYVKDQRRTCGACRQEAR